MATAQCLWFLPRSGTGTPVGCKLPARSWLRPSGVACGVRPTAQMAVARQGCCIPLLYGTARVSQSTVKVMLATIRVEARTLRSMGTESHEQLVCTSQGYCYAHSGYHQINSTVEIQHLDVKPGRWTARGAGVCSFPGCRSICTTITEYLPIEFQDLPCPECGQVVKYRYVLECVQMHEGQFVFTATVTCPRCTKQSVLQKFIKSLKRVKRVKVSPTGIELETHGS
jgi:hypothetical protein